MLTSMALILLLGLFMGKMFSKMKLPSLLGMIIAGMLLSKNALHLLDPSIEGMSGQIRQVALVIILTRAGLSLDISDLKKVGRPAILMCFVPASIEILGVLILAPKLLGITYLEAALMGSVIAAVSPAVVVPRMIRLMEEGYGKARGIPQLILAGASVDDVFVIVLFTAFTSLVSGSKVSVEHFFEIPISIILGIILGVIVGIGLTFFFGKFHMRDTVKVVIVLSVSFLLLEVQNRLKGVVPISGLLAIMSMGITIYQKYQVLAKRLSAQYNKLWVVAEVFLFVLVGAAVNLEYAVKAGLFAVWVVLGALVFRMLGVFLCLLKTKLTRKERIFCMIAYTPKATVQAAIGAIPLSMNLPCGQVILTVAVLSILITAPFGAICVDGFYKRLLEKG